MLFRYDFGQKLDLSRFEKQAPHYIGTMQELTYHLVVGAYQITAEIATPDGSNSHHVTLWFSEITRDQDGEIINTKIIIPLSDDRFQELSLIKELFNIDNYKAFITSNDAKSTSETLCRLVKLLHKINGLLVFL